MKVDVRTGYKVSNFWYKSDLMKQSEKWWQANKPLKVVSQDNAWKNKKLQAISDQAAWKLNHLVELGFTTITARAGVMISHANLNWESWLLSCKEAF